MFFHLPTNFTLSRSSKPLQLPCLVLIYSLVEKLLNSRSRSIIYKAMRPGLVKAELRVNAVSNYIVFTINGPILLLLGLHVGVCV